MGLLTCRVCLAGLLACMVSAGTVLRAEERAKSLVPAVLTPPIGHSGEVDAVAFTPDGRYLLSAGGIQIALRLWEIKTGRLVRVFGDAKGADAIAITPDGRRAVSNSGALKLWDLRTGRLIRTFPGHTKQVNAFAITPDGRTVVSGSDDGAVRLWDIKTGHLIRTLRGHVNPVAAVAVTPDGRGVVSGGADKTIRLWDVATGRLIRRFSGHSKAITKLAVARDGRRLVSGSGDRTLRVWNLATGKLIRTLKGHASGINALDLTPDGTIAVAADDSKGVRIWDLKMGRTLRALKGGYGIKGGFESIQSLAVSPDGRRIASGHFDRKINLWDLSTGRRIPAFETLSSPVRDVALTPDGRHLVAASNDTLLKRWDLETGRLIGRFSGHSAEVEAVAITPNGRRAVSGSRDNSLKIWDMKTGRVIRTLKGHRYPVFDVKILPDGRQATSKNVVFKLWDIETGRLIRTLTDRDVFGLTPDARGVITATDQQTVKLRDLKSGRTLRTFKGHRQFIRAAAVTPDGRHMVSGDQAGALKVWDLKTGRLVRNLEGHAYLVNAISVSPDGRHIVSAGWDLRIKVWERETGRLVHVLKGHAGTIRYRDMTSRDIIGHLKITPDGRTLVSAGFFRESIRLWDLDTGAAIGELNGHLAGVRSLRILPDGRRLISASQDGTIRIWDLATKQAVVTLIGNRNGEWLAITPEGYFAASKNGADLLSVVRGYEVYSIDQFYQTLYRPDLVREKLAGDPSGFVAKAAAELDLDKIIGSGAAPRVAIVAPRNDARVADSKLTVAATVTDGGGGIGRIEWRVNGRTLGLKKRGLERVDGDAAAPRKTITLEQSLWLDPGENVIEVVAYNARNLVASAPVRVRVTSKAAAVTPAPRLYVLSVGVNDYWDGKLRLNYAVGDAKALSAAFERAGRGLFDGVEATTLLDKDVNVDRLDSAFGRLAERVQPHDVFVFYLAGHGKTVDGRYHFLPQDFRYRDESSIAKSGINQDRLQAWFSRIAARKSVLIFDTCESGSLTGKRLQVRGLERVVALDKLTRAMGRTVLSASTDDAPALEGYKGHGLFTYTLLDALGRADGNRNGLIEVTELAAHVDSQVPAISHKVFGLRQVPQMRIVGSNFPLAKKFAALAGSDTAAPTIPTKPTHVVIRSVDVFPSADSRSGAIRRLAPGTTVTLVKSQKGWVLIAKEGKRLGFIAKDRLAPMQ